MTVLYYLFIFLFLLLIAGYKKIEQDQDVLARVYKLYCIRIPIPYLFRIVHPWAICKIDNARVSSPPYVIGWLPLLMLLPPCSSDILRK